MTQLQDNRCTALKWWNLLSPSEQEVAFNQSEEFKKGWTFRMFTASFSALHRLWDNLGPR